MAVAYRSRPRPSNQGGIYALQESDAPLVKIGCTGQPLVQRTHQLERQYKTRLRCVAFVPVPQSMRHIEYAIHRLLHAERIEGEWFYLHMSQERLESLVCQVSLGVIAQRHEAERWRLAWLS